MTAKLKIDQPIIAQAVLKKSSANEEAAPAPVAAPGGLNEKTERPEFLPSTSYKIKPPLSEHAMYITISDIVMNEGTEHEERRPFEIFLNSKDMDNYQWITAQMLLISALFRKGGDVTFIIDELKSVKDPNGGYFMKGGVFMPSLVAHIGSIIEKHMKGLGLIADTGMSDEQMAIVNQKREQLMGEESKTESAEDNDYPANATVCPKCSVKAVVIMDGCGVCLECGDSKCQ